LKRISRRFSIRNFFLESSRFSVYVGVVIILFVILIGVARLCFRYKNSIRGYEVYV
jgi:hypothetical protein